IALGERCPLRNPPAVHAYSAELDRALDARTAELRQELREGLVETGPVERLGNDEVPHVRRVRRLRRIVRRARARVLVEGIAVVDHGPGHCYHAAPCCAPRVSVVSVRPIVEVRASRRPPAPRREPILLATALEMARLANEALGRAGLGEAVLVGEARR